MPHGESPYLSIQPRQLLAELEQGVNAYRVTRRLRVLRRDEELACACRAHCARMRNREFVAHLDPDSSMGPFERARAYSSRRWMVVAENIAAGQWTAKQILEGWLESPAHRANLELPGVSFIGTAIALGGTYHTYITQLYADTSRALIRLS